MTPTADTLLRSEIHDLISRGMTRCALARYESQFAVDNEGAHETWSASTHHAAFVAARDLGVSTSRLDEIESRAADCTDFAEVELDFERDRALHTAEVYRDFHESRMDIDDVIRRRRYEEGRDLPADSLAKARIMLLESRGSERVLRDIEALLTHDGARGQTLLDIRWWHFVALLLCEMDHLAFVNARVHLASRLDMKPSRRRAWWVTVNVPWGPRLARVIIRRKLEL